jgi:hypothetical protein
MFCWRIWSEGLAATQSNVGTVGSWELEWLIGHPQSEAVSRKSPRLKLILLAALLPTSDVWTILVVALMYHLHPCMLNDYLQQHAKDFHVALKPSFLFSNVPPGDRGSDEVAPKEIASSLRAGASSEEEKMNSHGSALPFQTDIVKLKTRFASTTMRR